MNILYISPAFNYSCGVSKHVFINLKNLSQDPDYKLFFITNKGDSLERLQSIPGLNFSLFNFEKDHKNSIKLIKDFFQLLSYCKKYKIGIIHTHHRYPELVSVLVSKFTGVKTITTVHSFVRGMKLFSFRSDIIISVSKTVEAHLLKNYPHTKLKGTTIYNCIEESFYAGSKVDNSELRKSLGYADDDKILLFAGRISKIKGCDILIEAFAKLSQNLNVKLLMIGSVSEPNINSLLEKNRAEIKLLEPQKDMKPYYEISDAVVLPSREDPFPCVMLEAGAGRKPFIGGDTGGIKEFIENNITGFLVAPGNVEELSQKLKYVLENPGTAKLAGEKLFEKVVEFCNCEKYLSQLKNIYSELFKN